MTWERALEADARLAAKNAVLIRAALRQSFDAERAYQGYLNTTPNLELNIVQQRARARAWAVMNLRINLEPLKEVIYRTWAQAYVLGDTAAREAIQEAELARKADTRGVVDWSKWKPGDAAAAVILKPPRAFQRLLEKQGITWKGFSDTTLTDIGNAIGEAITLGLDAKASAKLIQNHAASPARALSIAITEQNRAISAATVERYQQAGLQQMEWLVFQPCDKCAQNAGKVVNIGGQFPSGDTQPPAHPHCRCALAPVIPGFDDQPIPGATVIAPPTPAPIGIETTISQAQAEAELDELMRQRRVAETGEFVPGQWTVATEEQKKQDLISRLLKLNPSADPAALARKIEGGFVHPTDLELIKTGIVYKNGPIQVQFYSAGKSVPKKMQQKLLKEVEELQITNPRKEMSIMVASNRGNAYGSAVLGDAKIWIKPDTVKTDISLSREANFKMPMITQVAQRQYTLAHEWGHSLDEGGTFLKTKSVQNATTTKLIEELKEEYKGKAFMSQYSGENTKEFYAEMFAEFYLSKGTTDNPLVQAMAKEFLWKAPAAPVVNTPAVAVSNYVTAKQPVSFFTAQKSNDFYGTKSNGEIDFSSFNKDGQNIYLKNILQAQGFNGKPKVVSAQEYKKYVDEGAVPIYRGISSNKKAEPGAFIEQYLRGDDPFVGKGMFGDGTYFASTRDVAESFAKTNIKGQKLRYGEVIDGVLNPQAKVVNIEDITRLSAQLFGNNKYDFAQDFYDDSSAIAAALGYDAIRIPTPVIKWGEPPIGSDYYIILNRTAVIVKEMP